MFLCQLLNWLEVLQLNKVDNVDCLDGENDASTRILLQLSNISICLSGKFEESEDYFEGGTWFSELVQRAANFLIECAALISGQVPFFWFLDNLSCSFNDNITAVLSQAELDELLKGKWFDARVSVHAIIELNEWVNFDLERELWLFDQEVNEFDSLFFCLVVISGLSNV